MVLAYEDVMQVIKILCEDGNFSTTIKESGKGALLAGGLTGLGGLILGPIGLALGGAVGGSLAAVYAQNKFKPLHQVIQEDLSPAQRQVMVEHMRNVMTGLEVTDVMTLMAMVQGNHALKTRLATEMVTFLSRQCNIYINE